MIQTINPYTEEVLENYALLRDEELKFKVRAAHESWKRWSQTSFQERAELVASVAQELKKLKNELAKLMAAEMGKPLYEGRAEIEKCAITCDYFAQNGADFLKDQIIQTEASKSYVSFQPLGVVLAIMPWNYPFWQVIRFAAPALMAGNAGLLKHAPNTTGCALALENIFTAAGIPENIFQTLIVSEDQAQSVIEMPEVAAVTLTGSTKAGRAVASRAGANLKKTVLELGGSDAYLVLEDADLHQAAQICVSARLKNGGQSCIAAKRFIVNSNRIEKFTELVVNKMEAATFGDPLAETTKIGPMARQDLRDHLHQQVIKSKAEGASCLLGGEIPDVPGYFYPPTVLTNVKKGMPAYSEELFGPVAAIIRAADDEEAIDIANDSDFGLGATVLSRNIEKAEAIARNELQAGSCFVNEVVNSDPKVPFGGIKNSGYGRELSYFGIWEFTNIKTIWVK